ncbi:putative ribonuclease H-like domain-containing protein [Tanacetum coccineum]
MQDELLQFKLQKVWTLVDLPYGKRAIGTKWIYINKKYERGIVVRNKARLVAQGYTQEDGIDYDEVFTLVARIEEITLFLAYALFKDFVVYQMDMKSAFLYSKIEEEVYVCQPLGFEDPEFPNRVYKVEKALYGLHQAPKAWYDTLSTYLLDNGFQRGQIDKTLFIKRVTGLQVTQKDDGIFISQDKYVDEILKKFGFSTVKTTSTPMETSKSLMKDENAEDVDVHLYRSMIGSLMYLIALRPDIMFVVCACKRFQVTPKISHLHDVKRIFRCLKGQPKSGLWYPKDSPFDLEAYTDSDYDGASLDRKSTTGGCQFFRRRLISWQCKKQTVVANSPTEAEYVAASTEYAQMMLETAADDAIQVSTVGLTYYTLDNGEMEITATIDGKVKIVSEASIRRHLKLEDFEGISNLPTTEILSNLLLWVFLNKHKRLLLPHNRTYIAPTLTQKLFSNVRKASKGYTGVDILMFPTMLVQGPFVQDEESTVPDESPTQTNVADEGASTGVDVRHGGAATTITSLDA